VTITTLLWPFFYFYDNCQPFGAMDLCILGLHKTKKLILPFRAFFIAL